MKWIAIIAGVLGLLTMLVYTRGKMLPREHQFSASVELPASVEQVRARITNVTQHPSWRAAVKKIDVERTDPLETTYVEHGAHGPLRMRLQHDDALISHIDDRTQAFGGRWIFRIESTAQMSQAAQSAIDKDVSQAAQSAVDEQVSLLTITEEGFVDSAIFRCIAHDVFGYETNVRQYLADLKASFAKARASEQNHGA
jgi:hypothetical protein